MLSIVFIAIAISASVTRSILAEISGTFILILFVKLVVVSTSFLDLIGDFFGTKSTSSKVKVSLKVFKYTPDQVFDFIR